MQVKSIADCSHRTYHLSLRSLFCLFLSGCFTQVLLTKLRNVLSQFRKKIFRVKNGDMLWYENSLIFPTIFIQHFADFRQPTVEGSVEHEARNYSYTRDHACHKQSY